MSSDPVSFRRARSSGCFCTSSKSVLEVIRTRPFLVLLRYFGFKDYIRDSSGKNKDGHKTDVAKSSGRRAQVILWT